MKETAKLIQEWWRQLHLPECPYCGAADIRRSRPRPWDWFLSQLSVLPYRCGLCLRRSYLRRAAREDVQEPKPGASDERRS